MEPDETNIRTGQYNFQQNHYEGEFIQAFVGQGYFEVDEFMKTKKLSGLDILHSDIQGFEIEMLNGSSEALRKQKIDYVFVSTHSQELHNGVIAKLKSHEYKIEVISDFEDETTSYDGFVFASSPLVDVLFDGFKPFSRSHILTSQPLEIVDGLIAVLNARKRRIAGQGG